MHDARQRLVEALRVLRQRIATGPDQAFSEGVTYIHDADGGVRDAANLPAIKTPDDKQPFYDASVPNIVRESFHRLHGELQKLLSLPAPPSILRQLDELIEDLGAPYQRRFC